MSYQTTTSAFGRSPRWAALLAASLIPSTFAQTASDLPSEITDADWAAIQHEHVQHEYGAVRQARGVTAPNRAHSWQAEFDGDGVALRPHHAAWRWGLELRRFGLEGCLREVATPATLVDGNRVAYQWNRHIEEWYVNDRKGLEHGYTVLERPARASDCNEKLVFELHVEGSLTGIETADRLGIDFINQQGNCVLSYGGLLVIDVNGVEVPAELRCDGDVVRFEIDDANADYPLLIDPIAQQAYLKASNTDANDFFGTSVAADGNRVVVGAPQEDSNATGVNGNGMNNSSGGSGAAYVFERSAGTWSQVAYLKASNSETQDEFGSSVAIFGDRVVVGAPIEDSASTGVNGVQVNGALGFRSGAAYVFNGSTGTWVQEAYLKASNTGQFDAFGSAVDITLDRIIVGAPNESSNATGVNGSGLNDFAMQAGAAYIFAFSGGAWAQEAYLKASNTEEFDLFGASVSISPSVAAVGAPDEDSASTGVNGTGASNAAPSSGAAYIYERTGTTWSQTAYVKASNTDAGDSFGGAVSIDADLLAVGALGEDSAATGVNGIQTDNGADRAGAAYLFLLGDAAWSQVAYLKASNTDSGDFFGASVDVSGQRVLVGALNEDGSSTGVFGDESDNSASNAGASYLFDFVTTNWEQVAYMKASNTEASDLFGASVSIDGDLVVIGALNEWSNAIGVNGNSANNSAGGAGAAYVFDIDVDVTPYCVSFPNITGQIGQLTWSNSNQTLNNNFTLTASSLPANEFGIFLASLTQANVPFAGGSSNGVLCLGGAIARFNRPGEILGSGVNGTFSLNLDLTDFPINGGSVSVLPGESWNFQAWHREQVGNGANFTNAIQVTFN